jgi:hypothetical protein
MPTPNDVKVAELQSLIQEDVLATSIANKFVELKQLRINWENECKETLEYVFATTTMTTSNSTNPWRNKTVLPKLCQIRDNLHANYMAALFPNDNFLKWESYDNESADAELVVTIQAYMDNKIRKSKFRQVVSQLVYDFIDYGNAIADVEYVDETMVSEEPGFDKSNYVGPRLVRISPMDVVFNPTASSFVNTPKLTRKIYSIADLLVLVEDNTSFGFDEGMIRKVLANRRTLAPVDTSMIEKAVSFNTAGFGDLKEYFGKDLVEIIELEGDVYDTKKGELLRNRIITIADRTVVLRNIENPSWTGKSTKQHVGWRLRPDNLYAMSPLANLVGMQYRINHLENVKADIFDMTAFPPIKIKGEVSDFVWRPLEKIHLLDDNADITALQFDSSALGADFQIEGLENKMEDMVGAPKQAMGIRTPGEKTAFEVQTLDNASGRMFQSKISYFEENFMEPLVNAMLELASRRLDGKDIISVLDDDLGVERFMEITKSDLTASGRVRPIGARHFAAQATMLQNLTQLSNSTLGNDPTVTAHLSGKKKAKLIEELLGLKPGDIYQENIGIIEQVESQQVLESAMVETGITPTAPAGEIPNE